MIKKVGVSLTTNCNLNCQHCFQDKKNRNNIDIFLFKKIVNFCIENNVKLISLTGGEPTLHPDYLKIIDMIHNSDLMYSITTNGWNIRKILEGCLIRPPLYITYSIEGYNMETHDNIRGNGSFLALQKSVILTNYSNLIMQCQTTLVKTILSNIHQIISFVKKNNAIRLFLALPLPTKNLLQTNNYPSYEELYSIKEEINKKNDFEIYFAIDNNILTNYKELPDFQCPYMKMDCIFISSYGDLTHCCQLNDYGSNNKDIIANISNINFSYALKKLKKHYIEFQKELHKNKKENIRKIDLFACLKCAFLLEKLDDLIACDNAIFSSWFKNFKYKPDKRRNRN